MLKKFIALLLCCILLTGCSGQSENPVSGTSPTNVPADQTVSTATAPPEEASSNLIIDRNQFFESSRNEFLDEDYKGVCVGIQFYHGEPVVLRAKTYDSGLVALIDGEYQVVRERSVYPDSGLYVQRMDGSTELLIPGIPLLESVVPEEDREKKSAEVIYNGTWYVDGEGGCYYTTYAQSEYFPNTEKEYFLKLDNNGKLLYKTSLEPGFEAEGFGCIGETMYVILGGETDGAAVKRVVAFDPETGVLSGTDTFVLQGTENARGENCFGWGADGLYLYDSGNGIQKVDLSEGSVSDYMPFAGNTWSSLGKYWKLKGFRVQDEGDVEALYSYDNEGDYLKTFEKGILEKLSLVKGERKTVTLRAASIPAWLKLQAADFNKKDSEYWVVLEELATSTAADLADYANLTNVELSAGKGPDILCGDLMGDYIRGLLDKGMLLELGGSMEAMSIQESDCLPAAFGSWREDDKIYGINLYLNPSGYKIRKDTPVGDGALDIYRLTDALSAREEDAVLYGYGDAGDVLGMLLEGSENLWGMVDWEHGTCDFSGDLFAQILNVAKRYGYDGKHRYQNLVRYMGYSDIYHFDSRVELEAEGMAVAGVLFDDGCHGAVDDRYTLAVNTASSQKEGTLKFLGYLLGEKAQAELTQGVPVNRAALEKWIENELEKVADGREYSFADSYVDEGEFVKFSKTFTEADMTEERVAEYLEALENVRILPYCTKPILDIVYREAADYFSGSKSIQEVAAVIRNKVQLYLDERK